MSKRLRQYTVLSVLFAALICFGVFTLGNVKSFPKNAWVQTGNSSSVNDYVFMELDKPESVGYVWLNVGRVFKVSDTENNVITVEVSFTSTSSNIQDNGESSNIYSSYVKKYTIDVGLTGDRGQFMWVRLNDTALSIGSREFVRFRTPDVVEINEIVFTSSDDLSTPLGVSVYGAGVWSEMANGNKTIDFVLKDKLDENNSAFNLLDEQSNFVNQSAVSKKNVFTDREKNVANTVLQIWQNQSGASVTEIDKNSGVLGLELIMLGATVFGFNPLGLRIVPFLFFLLSVVGVFLLSSKLFKNSDYGLITVVLYVLGGYPLTLGSLAVVDTIMLTFLIFSLYLFLCYYAKSAKMGAHTVNRRTFLPLILAGICYSLAILCQITALFALPVFILLFVLGQLKLYRAYKKRLNAATDNFDIQQAKTVYASTVTGNIFSVVVGFVLFAFLLLFAVYGIVGQAYMSFYGETSLLKVIFKHQGGMFNAQTGAQGSSIFGMLICLGTETLYTPSVSFETVFATYSLSLNAALQLFLLFAFIYTTIYAVAFLFKKDLSDSESKMKKKLWDKYLFALVGFLFTVLLFLTLKRSVSLTDYAMGNLFLVLFAPLFIKMMFIGNDESSFVADKNEDGEKTVTNKTAKIIICVAAVLIVVFFGIGFVSFAGIPVKTVIANILFRWWIR